MLPCTELDLADDGHSLLEDVYVRRLELKDVVVLPIRLHPRRRHGETAKTTLNAKTAKTAGTATTTEVAETANEFEARDGCES